MITEKFDSRTLANMEVALERACTNISGGEKHRARKYIADRIVRCARKGHLTLEALSQAGTNRSGRPAKPQEARQP